MLIGLLRDVDLKYLTASASALEDCLANTDAAVVNTKSLCAASHAALQASLDPKYRHVPWSPVEMKGIQALKQVMLISRCHGGGFFNYVTHLRTCVEVCRKNLEEGIGSINMQFVKFFRGEFMPTSRHRLQRRNNHAKTTKREKKSARPMSCDTLQ